MGWTHRKKNKSRDPYLKVAPGDDQKGTAGACFIDQDQKFKWYPYDEVVQI